MFTGIIEEVGTVLRTERRGSFQRMCVRAHLASDGLKPGDSVTVDGACQTVVATQGDSFWFESVEETLRRTTLGALRVGDRVNLERALRLDGRLGGHLVTGHVDGVGTVVGRTDERGNAVLAVEAPAELCPYLVEKGCVGLDGISLTVASVRGAQFTVWVVPYTLEHTTLGARRVGDRLNLEADILAKYTERLLEGRSQPARALTEEWVRAQGF